MIEPKPADERVLILGKGPYLVVVDGREVDRCTMCGTATAIANDWRKAINTTAKMCCAAQCPHCRDGLPFNEENRHHEDGKELLHCCSLNIRRELGANP